MLEARKMAGSATNKQSKTVWFFFLTKKKKNQLVKIFLFWLKFHPQMYTMHL